LYPISYNKDFVEQVKNSGKTTGYIISELYDAVLSSVQTRFPDQDANTFDDGLLPLFLYENYCLDMQTADWEIVLDGEKRGKVNYIFEKDQIIEFSPTEILNTKTSKNKPVKVCKKVDGS